MKSINFIVSNIRNKYDEIIVKKYISIPYDNIDEYINIWIIFLFDFEGLSNPNSNHIEMLKY